MSCPCFSKLTHLLLVVLLCLYISTPPVLSLQIISGDLSSAFRQGSLSLLDLQAKNHHPHLYPLCVDTSLKLQPMGPQVVISITSDGKPGSDHFCVSPRELCHNAKSWELVTKLNKQHLKASRNIAMRLCAKTSFILILHQGQSVSDVLEPGISKVLTGVRAIVNAIV